MHTPYAHMLQMAFAKIVRCMPAARPIKTKWPGYYKLDMMAMSPIQCVNT